VTRTGGGEGFGWETWRRRPLGRPRCRCHDNIRMDLQEVGWSAWTGLIWLRIGTGGWLLWMRWWTFGSIKCGNFLT